MSADQLRQLYDVSIQSVQHSLIALKKRCAEEGHVWMKETSHFEEEGGYTFCSGLGQTDVSPVLDVKYFTRKCVRCGDEEKKRGIEHQATSPFI